MANRDQKIRAMQAGALRMRPNCRGIAPDEDNAGRYCLNCGMELVDWGAWYRHGTEWRHPEVWHG